MAFYGKAEGKNFQLNLAKCLLPYLKKNSPEGYYLYWFNTMKPVNLPSSLSTGRMTIVPLLLCNLSKKKFQKFSGF